MNTDTIGSSAQDSDKSESNSFLASISYKRQFECSVAEWNGDRNDFIRRRRGEGLILSSFALVEFFADSGVSRATRIELLPGTRNLFVLAKQLYPFRKNRRKQERQQYEKSINQANSQSFHEKSMRSRFQSRHTDRAAVFLGILANDEHYVFRLDVAFLRVDQCGFASLAVSEAEKREWLRNSRTYHILNELVHHVLHQSCQSEKKKIEKKE